MLAARGIKPATAAEILARADERRIWYRLLHSEDENIALRTIIYLTDRREGRPAQQINVTGGIMHVSPEDIERAREIAEQLMTAQEPSGSQPPALMPAPDSTRR